MRNICDYMIIQRDPGGTGRGVFAGSFDPEKGKTVVARVIREDDNLTVVPWTICETDGNEWKITLSIPQGGLYRIEARRCAAPADPRCNAYDWADLIACARHVGVGDLFVMAGQSNMSGYGKDPAYDPCEPGVHLFNNAGKWELAAHPLNSVPDPIYPNNDSSSGTSPALSFGRMMKKRLGVPVGLIAAAQGGSALESWNPAEKDCYLFNSMKAKLEETGKFAGMIWYQGCNETGELEEAAAYYDKFCQAVSLWRESFGAFPIVLCQLNRHSWKGGGDDRHWGIVREAQRRAAADLEEVFIIPTIDMFTCDGIHNGGGANVVIGERMANVLLKGHYGLPGYSAPSVKRIKQLDSRTVLLEIGGEHMLRTMDDLASGINIEDENGLAGCTGIYACPEGATVKCERDIGENAVFHAYWRREAPAFFIRDIYGVPLLPCYGVKIEKQ